MIRVRIDLLPSPARASSLQYLLLALLLALHVLSPLDVQLSDVSSSISGSQPVSQDPFGLHIRY